MTEKTILVLVKLPTWAIAFILAKAYFIIWVVIMFITDVETLLQIVVCGVTGSFVFFIWCWFILSLWKRQE